jgi:Protein of unknown function (DUF3238)
MALESITMWLNAFIPNSVCVQKGDLFAIDVPVPVTRFFTGDQREFSNDINASARMHSEVRIEALSSDTPQLANQRQICGESHEVDDNGNIIASATASTKRMFFTNLRGSQTVDPEGGVIDGIPGSVQIDLVGSAGLPLIAAPDIDYSGTFTIDRVEGNVLFKGDISGFPAFEIYFSVNDGPPGTLAQASPLSPLDLIGEEDRPISVSEQLVL